MVARGIWFFLLLASSSISYASNSLSHVFSGDNSQAISAENLSYTSSTVVYCSCSGSWSDYFAQIDTTGLPAGAVPTGIRITTISARGDLDGSGEYLDFRVAGAASYSRYTGGLTTYRDYSYSGTQPSLGQQDGTWGFLIDLIVPSAVSFDPGLNPAGYFNLKIAYEITYSLGNELTIGESAVIDTIAQGAEAEFYVDASDAAKYSELAIGTRGGSGEVDLFVGAGFMPSPYQSFTCDSQDNGNTEQCVMPNPSGNYYLSVYGFAASSRVEVYAQGLGVPDAPVATSAAAADLGAELSFASPNANGSSISSYTARCALANTLSSETPKRSVVQPLAILPIDDTPTRLSLPANAAAVRFSGELSDAREGETIELEALGEKLSLKVSRAKTTPNDNLYVEGASSDGYPFRLLMSPEGALIGTITTASTDFLISPSNEKGIAFLQSTALSSMEPVTLGDDMRVVESDSTSSPAEPSVPTAPAGASSVIDVMFLYDGSLSSPVETIDYLLQYMNSVHQNSGTGAVFQATSFRQYNKSASGLPLSEIASSAQVASWRASDKADFVAWLGPYPGGGICGVAYVPGTNGTSYSATVKDGGFSTSYVGSYGSGYCEDKTLPHEIGHNLGGVHERGNSSLSPYYSYAWGDGIDGIFGTIQSYQRPGVDFFSSPLLTCAGRPCGQANYTDMARAIDDVRGVVSNIYEGDTGGTSVITVTPAAAFGGTVSPSTPQRVASGTVKRFTFTPDTGYGLAAVNGNCSGSLDGNVYEVTAGDIDCSFEGVFQPTGKYYSVRIRGDEALALSPQGTLKVTPFSTFSVNVTKTAGYAVVSVQTDCPGTYSGGVFSSGEITSDCSVTFGSGIEGNTASGGRSPILIEGLSPNLEYECSVLATNGYGPGPVSNTLSVTPFLASKPGKPSISRVDSEDGELLVYFTPGDTGRLDVTYTATCGEQSASASSSPIRVSGLANGAAVSCTVTATNSRGSSTSGVVVGTPEEFTSTGLPVWLLYQATQ